MTRLLCVLLLATSIARAEGVDVLLETTAERDPAAPPPRVVVEVHKAVKELKLAVSTPDGPAFAKRSGAAKAGAKVFLDLPRIDGVVHYEGALDVTYADGSAEQYPLAFDAEVMDAFTLTWPPDPYDEASHAVKVLLNRDRFSVRATAFDLDGKVIGEGAREVQDAPKGQPLSIAWVPKSKEPVARVEVSCGDGTGATATGTVTVWKLEIPHEEVNFDTAKHDLKPSERPKLDAVVPKIRAVLARAKTLSGLRLWIAGHTDTVDDRAYNQALSERRARTIAAYLQDKLKLPTSYAGFGEALLAVPTPDETPEARNRRAQYLLSITEPSTGVRWNALP